MNNYKKLIGLLALAIELAWTSPALGAKPYETDMPTSKNRLHPHAVWIPPALPPSPGIPCQEVRNWANTMTFTGCDKSAGKKWGGIQVILRAYAYALSITLNAADLKVMYVKRGLSGSTTRFQQLFNNIPVLKSFITIHQRPDKRVTMIHTSYLNEPIVEGAAVPVYSRRAAKKIALRGIAKLPNFTTPNLLSESKAELNWFPTSGRNVKLVWSVKTLTSNPRGDFYTLVDANTGKRLEQDSLLAFAGGTGEVFDPNPIQSSNLVNLKSYNDATSFVLDGQRVTVGLLGLNKATTLLKGKYVDLASLKPPTCPRPDGQCLDADNATRYYDYTRDQSEFEQVMVYNVVDSVQRYLRDILGFRNTLGQSTIRNFPTQASAHWYTDDNSFYSPLGDNERGTLHFGDGGVNDAEDADIIVHEFGHAIQHNQNPLCFPGGSYSPQVNDSRAIGEGFGDYLAASLNADKGDAAYQALNAACVGEWDSTAYRSTIPSCLRRVDGNKHYPDSLVGEVHSDGEIWSSALWAIRTQLTGLVTDQLVLEHHFNLDCSYGLTMPQAALEMINTDNLLFTSDHLNVLLTTFCDRGILVGDLCASIVSK